MQEAIDKIEETLRRPLKAVEEAALCFEADEPLDPLYCCMVHSLSKARDDLIGKMAQSGAYRVAPGLYESLQGTQPYSGWSATIELLHHSITLSLYRGWTWLGLNLVAFDGEDTCALDLLEPDIRANLRGLLRRSRVYTRPAYRNGLEEVLRFLHDLMTKDEQLPPSVDTGRLEVTFQGEVYRITERQSEFLTALLDRPGDWVAGAELRTHPRERLDRVKNRLPAPIRQLIESDTHEGYRINVTASPVASTTFP